MIHYDSYQRVEGRTTIPTGLLAPLPLLASKFKQETIDFISPILLFKGLNGIYFIIDILYNFILSIPCSSFWRG